MSADTASALPADIDVVLAFDTLDAMGGVQRVVALLAPELIASGVRTGVVTLRQERDRPIPTFPADSAIPRVVLGTEPAAMPYSPLPAHRALRLLLRGRVDAVRSFRAGAREMRAVLAEMNGPVVVCMQLQSAEYAIAGGVLPQRLVFQWHGSFEQAVRFRELDRIRWVSRRAATTLALNPGDAAKLADAGVQRTGWIRNPVDLDTLSRPDEELTPRRRRVVAAGRFVAEKGFDLLLDAWTRIADRHPGWELVVHGEGPVRDDLARRFADAASAGVRARLLPPTDDLPALLRQSGIHVLPSRNEGMGLVLAEAMCCGTPNVAFDCSSGVHELLADGAGILVPSGDVAALAETLSALMDDPDRRDAVAASGRARVAEFSVTRATEAWRDLLWRIDTDRDGAVARTAGSAGGTQPTAPS